MCEHMQVPLIYRKHRKYKKKKKGKLLIWLLCLRIKMGYINAVWLDDWTNSCLIKENKNVAADNNRQTCIWIKVRFFFCLAVENRRENRQSLGDFVIFLPWKKHAIVQLEILYFQTEKIKSVINPLHSHTCIRRRRQKSNSVTDCHPCDTVEHKCKSSLKQYFSTSKH